MTKNVERNIAEMADRMERREILAKAEREHANLRAKEELLVQGSRPTPLRVCAARRLLGNGRDDVLGNRRLLAAGERYAQHWELGNASPVSAVDIGGASGMASSDMSGAQLGAAHMMAYHKREYERASQALGQYFTAVVDPIVIAEEPIETVGLRVSGYRDRKQALAVAMDRLREGLVRLAKHFERPRRIFVDLGPTNHGKSAQDREARPDAPKALATHRPLAGMS